MGSQWFGGREPLKGALKLISRGRQVVNDDVRLLFRAVLNPVQDWQTAPMKSKN